MKYAIIMILTACGVAFGQDILDPDTMPSVPAVKTQKPIIAVPVFRNETKGLDPQRSASSGEYGLPDLAGEIAADATTAPILATRNYRLLSRSNPTMAMVNQEIKLRPGYGTDVSSALLASLDELQVDYLLLGRINRYRVDMENVTAYGVEYTQLAISVSMDLTLLDVKNHEIIMTKPMLKRVSGRLPGGMKLTSLSDWEPILRRAIEEAMPEFLSSIRPNMKEISTSESYTGAVTKVKIKVEAQPSGADVEYNGNMIGSTPCEIEVPAGVQGTLRISAPGYDTWEKRIMPASNAVMRIRPTLQKAKAPVAVPAQKSAPSQGMQEIIIQ